VERKRISSLESHGKALEKECCLPGVFCGMGMGVNATGTLGGRCAPSQKIYEFFIAKWCDMAHYGFVVFKIHVDTMDCSCMINFIEVPVCA